MSHTRKPAVHYAWVIAATAMLVVLGAVGLARFAFGMILSANSVARPTMGFRGSFVG